ncbi:DUF357 domain-containing protein [Candidatus Woesearchaeota archaeon]|nr:DUF357 domain-containing protein [Candidatus Woesearchaeota archaeon]
MNTVSEAKLAKYFLVTEKALAVAKKAPVKKGHEQNVAIIIDMVERYVSDAHHFEKTEDKVLAFAALNYAHGWLDCGARLGLFVVQDSALFTADNTADN